MSERWYHCTFWGDAPKPVTVLKETEYRLVIERINIDGQTYTERVDKSLRSEAYVKAWADARNWMILCAKRHHDALREQLTDAAFRLARAQSIPMEEPK